jgi:dimethylamine monooxygenase subunit C
MPKLEHTSVPPWTVRDVGTRPPEPDRTGGSYLLVGVGTGGRQAVSVWAAALEGCAVRALVGDDADAVATDLSAALAETRVGARLRIAGPVGTCLTLRGVAVSAGVEDDELHVSPTGTGPVDIWCVHCAVTTAAEALVTDVVACAGCGRNLLVYHHVSRRTGRFLGFQVDAEEVAS